MSLLADANMVVIAALLLGTAGGAMIAAGLRWRFRRGVRAGAVAGVLGFAAFGLIYFGFIPAAYLEAVDRWLRPPLAVGASMNSVQADRLLHDAELGVLSDADFSKLLGAITPNRSVGSRGGSTITMVEDWLRADRLGERYVDLTIDWLIANGPSWNVGPNEVDNVPLAVVQTIHATEASRDRFVDYLLAQIGDPKQSVSHGWYDALDWLVYTGRMDRARLSLYIGDLAARELTLEPNAGAYWRGDWAVCRIANPAGPGGNRPNSHLPIRGSISLRDTGVAFKGGKAGLPIYFGEGGAELATIQIPDAPGTYQLIADVDVQLTHDALRSHFDLNPQLLSSRIRIKDIPEVRVSKRLTLNFVVKEERGAAPERLGGDDLAARLSACVRLPDALASVQIGPDGANTAGGSFSIDRPSVTMVMDVLWVVDGKEHVVGWFVALEGKTTEVQYRGDVGDFKGGSCTMMLRPNLSMLKNPRGVSKVYDGPALTFPVSSYTR